MLRHRHDTVLLSGWLFADLLLGLMVIFMASLPGKVPLEPPKIVVSPTQLTQNNAPCSGGFANLQCTLTIAETVSSRGGVHWNLHNDFASAVQYSPASGSLQPGRKATITITSIACQNGSFLLTGSNGLVPVIIPWHCQPKQQRLERTFCRLILNDGDPDKFSTDLQFAKSVLEPQINGLSFLKGREVGIAIAVGGADNIDVDATRGSQMAAQAYLVLQDMGNQGPLFHNASYYTASFTTFYHSNNVIIDVYLVIRQDNSADTCDPNHNYQPIQPS